MVYYGALSKGCQRCRQRKIKCDERKPGCLRCEKSSKPCPGYRNLTEILFRDESDRVVQKARRDVQVSHSITLDPPCTLSQPINDLGANFFFTKYSFQALPFSKDYYDWLARSYAEESASNILREAIDAVGIAGISNISPAPHLTAQCREKYSRALATLNQLLSDPLHATADTTLMAVILLAFFETINGRTSNQQHRWQAHIEGAITLLQLRGRDQFTRERGGQLYLQIRTQILSLCMEHGIPVPPPLVQATYNFQSSILRRQWQFRNVASPASMSEISFRIVNLRAALIGGTMDVQTIRDKAIEIDLDLETWKAGVFPTWMYTTLDDPSVYPGGKRHVYPSLWIAYAWIHWRTLRVLVNQIMLQYEVTPCAWDMERRDAAISTIWELSMDIFISISSLVDTPRAISLIEPLYIVAAENVNSYEVRRVAITQLRRISEVTGVRQAVVLAEIAENTLNHRT